MLRVCGASEEIGIVHLYWLVYAKEVPKGEKEREADPDVQNHLSLAQRCKEL